MGDCAGFFCIIVFLRGKARGSPFLFVISCNFTPFQKCSWADSILPAGMALSARPQISSAMSAKYHDVLRIGRWSTSHTTRNRLSSLIIVHVRLPRRHFEARTTSLSFSVFRFPFVLCFHLFSQ